MRNIMKYGILILTLTFILNIRITAQQTDMVGSLNSFSLDLYKQLKSDKENLFFSPFSIDVALLIAKEGAKSATKTEFEKVLHVDSNLHENEARDFVQQLKSFKYSSNQLNVSNSIWIQNNYRLKTEFQNKIQTNYFADIFHVNFADKLRSTTKINNWAAQKTNNLIKDLISPDQITVSTKLVLINAIYFKDRWDKEFEKHLTKKDDFYGVNNDTVKIDFMHESGYYNYFENADFQYISKDYAGKDKSFCVILPKKRDGICSIDTIMDKTTLDSIFKLKTSTLVDLSIPKFKLEASYSLNKSLSKLGLKNAFAVGADFSGISATSHLKISHIIHKTHIEINEEMTEAAAATKISCADGLMPYDELAPKPKVFIADHPFMFMIIDTKTKGIIFMGRYVKQQ
jgi:serpin B